MVAKQAAAEQAKAEAAVAADEEEEEGWDDEHRGETAPAPQAVPLTLTAPRPSDSPWSMDLSAHDFIYEAKAWLIELGGMTTDGIFRVAGSNDTVVGMKQAMLQGQPARDVLRGVSDVHDVSTCLGRWLREQPMMIPTSAFTQLENVLLATAAAQPQPQAGHDVSASAVDLSVSMSAACESFMVGLPEPGQALLRTVLMLLQEVDADATRMTADNLSRVFALTIIKRENPLEMAAHCVTDASFVSLLIQSLPSDDHAKGRLQEEWRRVAEAQALQAEAQADAEAEEEEAEEDEAGDSFVVDIDVEQADGTVDTHHSNIPVKKTETMGSVKRRMSVSSKSSHLRNLLGSGPGSIKHRTWYVYVVDRLLVAL